jgi:predicted signal transduction protein with EAL and GGDEF domain
MATNDGPEPAPPARRIAPTDAGFDEVERRLERLAELERELADRATRLVQVNERVLNETVELDGELPPALVRPSRYDEATGLLNAVGFGERLGQSILLHAESVEPGAVLLLRVDGLADAGAGFAETAARQVADRLRVAVRGADLVARLDGSSFGVWLGHLGAGAHATAVARKLADRTDAALRIDGQPVPVTCTVGIAVFPADGVSGEVLMEHAEASLQFAQAHGLRMYQFFSPASGALDTPRLQLHARLRRDLDAQLLDAGAVTSEEDPFRVEFEPQVEIGGRRVLSLDARLAWRTDGAGWREAETLAADIAGSGSGMAILRLLLRRICAAATGWPDTVGVGLLLPAAVLRDDTLVREVDLALRGSGLAAGRLRLDVTEAALGRQTLEIDSGAATLAQLRALGVRLGLERYGSGACSLALLRACPVDVLRIDGSLVQRIASDASCRALVSAVATYGRACESVVVACGVTDELMLDCARRAGCEQAQGPLFGPPLAAGQVVAACTTALRCDSRPALRTLSR